MTLSSCHIITGHTGGLFATLHMTEGRSLAGDISIEVKEYRSMYMCLLLDLEVLRVCYLTWPWRRWADRSIKDN